MFSETLKALTIASTVLMGFFIYAALAAFQHAKPDWAETAEARRKHGVIAVLCSILLAISLIQGYRNFLAV